MGRASRRKRERRDERRMNRLPPCSYQRCPNGRPPGTHLIRKMADAQGTGEFMTACADCVEPMMVVIRTQGVDAQVFTGAALLQLSKVQRQRAATAVGRTAAVGAPQRRP